MENRRLAAETHSFGLGSLQGHGWEGSVVENRIPRLQAGTLLLYHSVLPFPSLYMVAHPFPPHPHKYPQDPFSLGLAATQVSPHLGQVSPSEGSAKAWGSEDDAAWAAGCRLRPC